MARAPSLTHDIVVLKQHNGELQEDVMERCQAAGGWLDAEIDDSFPASDPLSQWAGPRRRAARWTGHTDTSCTGDRSRTHPSDSIPKRRCRSR